MTYDFIKNNKNLTVKVNLDFKKTVKISKCVRGYEVSPIVMRFDGLLKFFNKIFRNNFLGFNLKSLEITSLERTLK